MHGIVVGANSCCDVCMGFTVVGLRMRCLGCLCLWVISISHRPTGVVPYLFVGEGGVPRLCAVGIICPCILHVRRLMVVLWGDM